MIHLLLDWLNQIIDYFQSLDATSWGAIAATLAVIVPFLENRWQAWRQNVKERRLRSDLLPVGFTQEDITRSTRYYVQSDCSDTDPTREEEIRSTHAVIKRSKTFTVIDSFLNDNSMYRHMIILADSGMGKTSLLLNYYAINQKRPPRNRRRIALIPLGIQDADTHIIGITDKENTILFLDAFDEDIKTKPDHGTRLAHLMSLSKDFQRVVITCRTQFFPKDEEIPEETGIIRVAPRKAGEGNIHKFQKLYLMPLTDKQVRQYLWKQYPLWNISTQLKARNLVEKVPNLSVRPMLLSYLPELLTNNKPINKSYELYENLINAWIARERGWTKSENLRTFSELLAVDLYINSKKRGFERIPRSELSGLANKWNLPLDEWQLTSRSLLNRDAKGNYKFAHRSIMEYLFIRCENAANLNIEWEGIQLTDQMKTFIIEIVSSKSTMHLVNNAPNIDLKFLFVKNEINLSGTNLSGIDLSGADLSSANLSNTNLSNANLSNANLSNANLSEANLHKATLHKATLRPHLWGSVILRDTNLSEADLSEANLHRADLSNADLKNANLSSAKLNEADLSNTDLSSANLSSANLSSTNLSNANLNETDLSNATFNKITRWPIDFNPTNYGALLDE